MVGFTKLASAAVFASSAIAAPVAELETRQAAAYTDADILQFALTAEHLENVFYKGALQAYPMSAFTAANFSAAYYNNLKYVAHDEEQHVILLSSALAAAGANPVAACTYKFPYTTPTGFVGLASILEGVGSAAYLGAAPAISSKAYLGVAGSILVTEAIHTSIQRVAVGEVGPANPYGSALTPNSAYSLLAAFIVSCPSTNVALPFKAFPSLAAIQGQPTAPGISFVFAMPAVAMPTPFYVTFVNGLTTVSQAASVVNGRISTTIPLMTGGQTYAFVTSSNVTAITDAVVVAGPAILEVTPNAPTYNVTLQ